MDHHIVEDLLGIGAFAPAIQHAVRQSNSRSQSKELLELLNQKEHVQRFITSEPELLSSQPSLMSKLIELDQDINKSIQHKTHEKNFFPFLILSAIFTIFISPILVETNQRSLQEGVFNGSLLAKSALFLIIAIISMMSVWTLRRFLELKTKNTWVFTAGALIVFVMIYFLLIALIVGLDPLTRLY